VVTSSRPYLRKLVHVGGVLFVPVAMLSPSLALGLALLGILLFFVVDYLKGRVDRRVSGLLYRENELRGQATEPLTYLLAIAALLAIALVFSPYACYAAIVVLTVGGLAGRLRAVLHDRLPRRRPGRHRRVGRRHAGRGLRPEVRQCRRGCTGLYLRGDRGARLT
jgi:hypothetical protein